MSPELIRYNKKVESFKDVLKQHGFEDLEFFWYSDGFYNARWADMSQTTVRTILRMIRL